MVHPGQGAGLGEKLVQPVAEEPVLLRGVGQDAAAVRGAHGQIPRQVFLDRHRGLQLEIPAQVGDAEAAGLAEYSADEELPVEQAAQGQGLGRARGLFVESAMGARVGRALVGKTPRAEAGEIGVGVHRYRGFLPGISRPRRRPAR